MAKSKVSKSAPPTPQKPAAPETPAESKGRPYVSAFFPPARKKMLDELLTILTGPMGNKRVSEVEPIITKFMEAFNRHMEEATRMFDVDDVGICIGACKDIENVSHSLDNLIDVLDELPEDSAERGFADLIRPSAEWLHNVVFNEFPNLKLVRDLLVADGYGDDIRG